MRRNVVLAVAVIGGVAFAGSEQQEHTLGVTLETTQSRMLLRESIPLRAYLVNTSDGPANVPSNRVYVQLDLRVTNDWTPCSHGVQPGEVPSYFHAPWRSVAAGDRVQASLPDRQQCLCKQAANGNPCQEWFSKPGVYEFRARAALGSADKSNALASGGPKSQLVSNSVLITVVEPAGMDAEAYKWATEHGTYPSALDVVARFPSSRYAATVLSHYICAANDVRPQEVIRQIAAKQFPPLLSVPDLSDNGKLRNLGGTDAARWRVEQAERLLREDLNYSPILRMDLTQALGVNLIVIGETARGLSTLDKMAKPEDTRQARWAREFLTQYRP